jgi:F-type H+-transporting ATPase subunit alpha
VGISVSRVGGSAQTKMMKQVAGTLRLDLAQYREMAAFAQFASDLDKNTQQQLARGERLVELLKQSQYKPMSTEHQVLVIFAGTKGFVDHLPLKALAKYERELIEHFESKQGGLMATLRTEKAISGDSDKALRAALDAFNKEFVA